MTEHLASLGHPGDEKKGMVVLCDKDGKCIDVLTGETLSPEDVDAAIEQCERYAKRLRNFKMKTCGAHPTLVVLATNGIEWPNCDGGYQVVDAPKCSLHFNDSDGWCLNVVVRYAHSDAPDHEHTRDDDFIIKDGKLVETGRWGEELADINDLQACEQALRKHFHYDGG